jgi:hypothetical protein
LVILYYAGNDLKRKPKQLGKKAAVSSGWINVQVSRPFDFFVTIPYC